MKRPWHIWLAFGICALVAVGAVGWLSYRTIESDRADAVSAERAVQEELARLALWRLDSAAATLLAQENSQPYFVYESFTSLGQLGRPQLAAAKAAKSSEPRLLPSPLLVEANPRVLLHFQLDASGELGSPSVPPAPLMERAVPAYLSAENVAEHRRQLDELSRLISPERLLAAADLPLASSYPAVASSPAPNPPPPNAPLQSQTDSGQQAAQVAQTPLQQSALNASEFQARAQISNQVANQMFAPAGVRMSVMKPLWLNDQLLLVRRVSTGAGEVVQGVWLDWPALRRQLQATVSDLLPDARLEPFEKSAASGGFEVDSHLMAVLPVALDASLPTTSNATPTPVRAALWIIWCSVALAIAAIALLLKGVLTLSERRAAFVSAVTHELRTPLTTLRMYAEMLADGMVPDEASRHEYLETLRREADRLTHLVENVLAYAQIERGSVPTKIQAVPVSELVEQARDRLTLRAAQAGFQLKFAASPEDLQQIVLADPAAVERILFNLVDNACKYANSATERTLEMSIDRQPGRLLFKLRDHGPGLSDRERKRLFQPFRKSASDAAHSAPGIGLGLALSRRLARQLDGELSLENGAQHGACFVLSLPVSS